MDRKSSAWVWLLFPLVGAGVAETTDPWTHLESIAGRLVFYQMEGNATRVRNTGELASRVPTKTTFERFDPQKNFSTAKFTYTWDLGDGQVIRGREPVVRYRYSASGNYTLRLKVGANVTTYSPAIADVYSTEVQVLDAIKSIELKGPSDYQVSKNTSLAFHVDGRYLNKNASPFEFDVLELNMRHHASLSPVCVCVCVCSPPMWVCWRFLTDCVADEAASCTLTALYGNTLRLNHTFTAAGVHCVDISVHNDVSRMQTSFSLYVRNNNTHLIFILSCAAVLLATFSFIAVIACRPRHRHGSQVATCSNAVFLKNQDAEGQSAIVFNFSDVAKGEKEPLLTQHGTQ
uniref:transmembrane protein 130 isoform X1 n=1 Tax=Gasterosteus aculeatus aculeatus TaxID=481459 RepID=UPI001A985537|nr:transmembrane protein 130 isoform X1 [Gasterosteus aculeatus aculeatus]